MKVTIFLLCCCKVWARHMSWRRAGLSMVHHVVGRAKSVGGASQYRLGEGAKSGLPLAMKGGKETFTVLGIETSCDDTGAAVVRSDGAILGEALASQHEIHESYGGVVPGLARDAHERNLGAVVEAALKQAGMAARDVDAVAVTVGPGLEICLRVGAAFARAFALKYTKPFVAVHHLEAHCLLVRPSLSTAVPAGFLSDDETTNQSLVPSLPSVRTQFPFLALLVSGGHCQILFCHAVGNYTVLGGTLDDALGEAFDKAARMLGLRTAGAGGPAIEALALDGDSTAVELPVPMQKRKDCDFSYAGLKNAFRLAVQKAIITEEPEGGIQALRIEGKAPMLSHQVKADLAASFQRVAIRHLLDRVDRAIRWCYEQNKTSPAVTSQLPTALAVVGGVAANKAVRRALQELCETCDPPLPLVAPPARLCTDNGVMVAWAAIEKLKLGISDEVSGGDDAVHARWPLGSHMLKDIEWG